ncbi:MAG: ATP-dependent sacrificial sulfur transferase LarE [Phycisphaerae bacterium]|jgi:uncharacterized protein|nr:ATP-dependent sacrificial sulfur transferase LarE [Phycisphaerae bacterium]
MTQEPLLVEGSGDDIDQKLSRCRSILLEMKSAVVAFSAGVDSTFLLALAVDVLGGNRVLAAIGVSPSLPQRELTAARELADRFGIELTEIATGELDNPEYAANPAQRCYFCKRDLFSRLSALAQERGLGVVLSGANADDTGDFRPGMQAGTELGVRSPLLEAELTKADIRELSRLMGLPTWDKPAMACLASRVPYGETITSERLARIERAEQAIRDMGFRQVRVRDHGDVARIEIPADDLARLVGMRTEAVVRLKGCGYTFVSMDLEGFRSGSFNEILSRSGDSPPERGGNAT